MESDFFSIVALVIALTGAAFTLILTVREMTREFVAGMKERTATFMSDIAGGNSKDIRAVAAIINFAFWLSFRAWRLAVLTPIILFAAYAWISTDQVLESHQISTANQQSYDLTTRNADPKATSPDPKDPAAAPSPPVLSDLSAAGNAKDVVHWFAVCGDCQMNWLLWTRRIDTVCVVAAIGTLPAMWAMAWVLSKLSASVNEAKIKPAPKPNRTKK